MIFRRKYENTNPVYTRARKRLETVTTDEVLRYLDNLQSTLGNLLQENRRNLTRNPNEVSAYCQDLKDAAQTMLAASDVLELR